MAKNERKAAEPAKIHCEHETKVLRCNLTPEEMDQKTVALTQAIDSASRVLEEKKSVMADFKARDERAQAEIQSLNQIVRNRYEMRPVECETAFDFTAGTVTVIRNDTGAII